MDKNDRENRITQLKELVDQFAGNIDEYKSNHYNETNTRVDYIDKFFDLLGWDMANEKKEKQSLRDVVREDKVKIGKSTKSPDYTFRIKGKRKFFVEAKKPSVNIKEAIAPAFQLRRYAWTEKLTLSILTDFEEFAVYDTRYKPNKNDNASFARIFYCTYDEYEKYFDYIYHTFSKEAVFNGSFNIYIEENKNKKGTSPVDDELLAVIEDWRVELAKNIAKNNPKLSIYNLNAVVQKIIDRIIFIRIAEDRGIEDEDLLKTISESNRIYERLNQIFTKVNIKYNSEIFAYQEWEEKLIIDDKVFINIIKDLYYPDCPYEFSVLPVEILGSIYERFLGSTIRFRGIKGDTHTAIIEQKPEVKKAGGVFYTPEYIVEYIVQNTVGEKIKNKRPEEVSQIKICDPACGSGSFLVGAYQFLLNYHLDYYSQEKNKTNALKNSKIYEVGKNSYKLTIEEKQNILINNIFGVDIDNQAVEVTKLSLYLKLLEDEEQGLLINFSDRALLPIMENNIKCGNSLIGRDFYAQGNLDFSDDERIKINCFDWEKGFSDIIKNGGFDIIVGNPPYVNIENLDANSKEYFFKNYKTCQGRTDIYIPFIEKCTKNIKTNGLLSFIIPYAFTNQTYGSLARESIIKNMYIRQITDTSNYYVFKSANVKNIILLLEKKQADNKTKITIYNSEEDFITNKKTEFLIDQNEYFKLKDFRFETKPLSGKTEIKDKIWENSVRFDCICFIAYGVRINHKTKNIPKSSYIHEKRAKGYKPFIEGKNIDRYTAVQEGWLDYRPNEHYNSMFPELFENEKLIFINVVKDRIRFAYDDKKLYNSHTVINCVRYDKLIKADHISAKKALKEINITECKDYSLKYLLGLLNSNLLNWYFVNFLSESLHFYPNDAKNMPIRKIDFINKHDKTRHDYIVSCVDKIIELKEKESCEPNSQQKAMITSQIEGIEQAINDVVYELYGLTDDEIKIVEGK